MIIIFLFLKLNHISLLYLLKINIMIHHPLKNEISNYQNNYATINK